MFLQFISVNQSAALVLVHCQSAGTAGVIWRVRNENSVATEVVQSEEGLSGRRLEIGAAEDFLNLGAGVVDYNHVVAAGPVGCSGRAAWVFESHSESRARAVNILNLEAGNGIG